MSRSGMDTPYVKNLALRSIEAGVLRVAYQDLGPSGGGRLRFCCTDFPTISMALKKSLRHWHKRVFA